MTEQRRLAAARRTLRLADGLPLPVADRRRQSRAARSSASRRTSSRRACTQFNVIVEKEFSGNVIVGRLRRLARRQRRVRRAATSISRRSAPGAIQPRRRLLRAAAERHDDRPVRERLRVELQRAAAGLPAPPSRRPVVQLELHAGAQRRGRSRRRGTSSSIERFDADIDIRHRFVFSANYELPFGRSLTGVAKRAARRLAGQRASPTGRAACRSTSPTRRRASNTARRSDRPNLVGEPELDDPTIAQLVQHRGVRSRSRSNTVGNVAAQRAARAAAAAPRSVALQGRRADGGDQAAVARSRSTTSPTRRTSPTRIARSATPGFGTITSTGNSIPRQMQFALKLLF